MKTPFPVHCPACKETLAVTSLSCSNCHTDVSGKYQLPVLMQLTQEEQDFVLQFFLSSGSLKEMAKQMGNSYPTVRNKLDDMIEKVKKMQETKEK